MPYKPKTCTMCETVFQPTGSVQKVCKSCAPEYKRQQNVKALRELRAKQGSIPMGSILNCTDCGQDFEYRSGPQKRCPSCQQAHKVSKIREWLVSDKERLKQYTKKARDNYYFGGNRDAALERDNHTCQHCGSKDDLQVHHIDGNGTTTSKEHRNNVLENLQTLCRGCHTRVHTLLRHSS